MAEIDTLDLAVLVLLLVGTIAYFTKGKLWATQQQDYFAIAAAGGKDKKEEKSADDRNIVAKMKETGKNCVVFYGSQTGTAEDYASRLSKEGAQKYGLKTMIADLEEFDFDGLDAFPKDYLAMFVMATYGEGEPTDNAVDFSEFIESDDSTFSKGMQATEQPLANFKYVAFGLGNNTYEHYNGMIRRTDAALQKLGATRIGEQGEGDDGAGTMEEDFLAWKDPMWAEVASSMNLEERDAVYEPVFDITDKHEADPKGEDIYLGEPNKNHLAGKSRGPFGASNPFIAPIVESTELFEDENRNCIHAEIDLSGSNMPYQTGDHCAVWPTNSGKEVDRFLHILDLQDKRDMVIDVKSKDGVAKPPFPCPTTYDTVVRYHMEICAPLSRQFVGQLAQFAPNDKLHEEVAKIGGDKDYFREQVSKKNLNVAQFMEYLSKGEKWTKVPFSLFIEGLLKLQPRYYSISSSSAVQKDRVSITAVVESISVPGAPYVLKGVATNYILALSQKQHGVKDPDPNGLKYALEGPRNKYDGIHVPVHIRGSNFKLPSDPARPVIMVGPGTGVAPFRGFVQERAYRVQQGDTVGKTLLFFGCRKSNEDYLYKDEWNKYKEIMGDSFEIVTAFSRETADKVYVQHRLKERAEEVNKLLEQKAFFYVCGDAARMARDVNAILGQIIASQRGLPESQGEEMVKKMRNSNQYQEDVWS